MKKKSNELQGAGQLTMDAVIGVIDIVEALHATISRFGGVFGDSKSKRTSGITGLVYKIIRLITGKVGFGVDRLLYRLNFVLGQSAASPTKETVISALNGVLGDYLAIKNNPLALQMQFRQNGQALDLSSLSSALQKANGKLLVLAHGLCMNDLQWNAKGHDHGVVLGKELGMTPIYLYYNTGRHISENGRSFSLLLEQTLAKLPSNTKIYILAHSMGGLVARSACHYAETEGKTWCHKLEKLIFLGTPHHGAPLEKGGNWIDFLLGTNPYSAPFAKLGKIRSAGITDMRFGSIIDKDWIGVDRFEFGINQASHVPLLENCEHYAIATTTSETPNRLEKELIGDGLVPISSALGQHKKSELQLNIPAKNKWVGSNINHMELLYNLEVYQIVKKFMNE